MGYAFKNLDELKRLLSAQVGGFILDACYREEPSQLVATITVMSGTTHTGILPRSDEALSLVREKNWRKMDI